MANFCYIMVNVPKAICLEFASIYNVFILIAAIKILIIIKLCFHFAGAQFVGHELYKTLREFLKLYLIRLQKVWRTILLDSHLETLGEVRRIQGHTFFNNCQKISTLRAEFFSLLPLKWREKKRLLGPMTYIHITWSKNYKVYKLVLNLFFQYVMIVNITFHALQLVFMLVC